MLLKDTSQKQYKRPLNMERRQSSFLVTRKTLTKAALKLLLIPVRMTTRKKSYPPLQSKQMPAKMRGKRNPDTLVGGNVLHMEN